MTLLKTSFLSFIATALKMLAGLAISKAVAMYIGPTGLALIGQFQNFSQLVMTVAQGASGAGVTKYVAEYGSDYGKTSNLLNTAWKINLFTSTITGAWLIFFSSFLSLRILDTYDYSYIFIVYGFTVVFYVANGFLLSALNGLKDIKLWVAINIIQSLYSLVFTTLLIYSYGLGGALVASVTNQSVVLLAVVWMLRKHTVIRFSNITRQFDKGEAKKLVSYGVMIITSSVTVPLSHLFVRDHIVSTLGWDDAGYWQAIWYISTVYLMVVTTTLGVYYLPRLSELTDKTLLRKELLQGYLVIIPIAIAMSATIYILRDLIIWLLFTPEFKNVRDLFLWQMIGDVIKIGAWLISYLLLAKAMIRIFVITEVLFNITFVLFSILFVDQFGLIGVTYSYSLNYALYLIVIAFATRKAWR